MWQMIHCINQSQSSRFSQLADSSHLAPGESGSVPMRKTKLFSSEEGNYYLDSSYSSKNVNTPPKKVGFSSPCRFLRVSWRVSLWKGLWPPTHYPKRFFGGVLPIRKRGSWVDQDEDVHSRTLNIGWHRRGIKWKGKKKKPTWLKTSNDWQWSEPTVPMKNLNDGELSACEELPIPSTNRDHRHVGEVQTRLLPRKLWLRVL